MNGTQTWRDKPREQGKAAYREGKSLDANPYTADSGNSLSWAEGWIWSKVHFPRPEHRDINNDPDLLEPDERN